MLSENYGNRCGLKSNFNYCVSSNGFDEKSNKNIYRNISRNDIYQIKPFKSPSYFCEKNSVGQKGDNYRGNLFINTKWKFPKRQTNNCIMNQSKFHYWDDGYDFTLKDLPLLYSNIKENNNKQSDKENLKNEQHKRTRKPKKQKSNIDFVECESLDEKITRMVLASQSRNFKLVNNFVSDDFIKHLNKVN